MDVYLPADFRTLRDQAPDDWRDVSSASASCARSAGADDDERSRIELQYGCVDPLWRVF